MAKLVGLTIGRRLMIGAVVNSLAIAVVVLIVYQSFQVFSADVTHRTTRVVPVAQQIVRLGEGFWQLKSELQSMQAATSEQMLDVRRSVVEALLLANEQTLVQLVESDVDELQRLTVRSTTQFKLTAQIADTVAVDQAKQRAALSALLERGPLSFNAFVTALDQVGLTEAERAAVLQDSGVVIPIQAALNYVREQTEGINALHRESLIKVQEKLALENKRASAGAELLAFATQFYKQIPAVAERRLATVQKHLNKAVSTSNAGEIRSASSRFKKAAKRLKAELNEEGVLAQLEQLSQLFKVMAEAGVEDEKVHNELAFLGSRLHTAHRELIEVLHRVDAQLTQESAKGSTELLQGMGGFVSTVGLVGVISIVVSLLFAWWIRGGIVNPLNRVLVSAQRLNERDLGQDAELVRLGERNDEIGSLASTFASLSDELREMVGALQDGTRSLAASTAQITTTAQQTAATAAEQAGSVNEVSATTAQLLQTGNAAAASADKVASNSETSAERGQKGHDSVAEATHIMQVIGGNVEDIAAKILLLNEQNSQIAGIVDTVNDIAEQSNLLAVNASIEASKAGEQGRGFAVVATEVRNLAEQSKRSTGQIRTILEDIQKATQSVVMATEEGTKRSADGVNIIDSVRTVIAELAEALTENADTAHQIAGAAAQQASGTKQIAEAMQAASQASNDSAAGARELEKSAMDLSQLAGQLESLAARYTL